MVVFPYVSTEVPFFVSCDWPSRGPPVGSPMVICRGVWQLGWLVIWLMPVRSVLATIVNFDDMKLLVDIALFDLHDAEVT